MRRRSAAAGARRQKLIDSLFKAVDKVGTTLNAALSP